MRLSSEMREIHRCYRYRPRGRCWAVYLDITYRQGDSFPPRTSTGRETVGEFPGYSCGYCQGNGYFQGDITVKDTELVPCPKCGGTGKVKGIVTVDWVPDGEVKPCLRGNSNNI